MRLVQTFVIISCVFLLTCGHLRGQSWLPLIINNNGDTVSYAYPPPDSSFVSNEVIIIFHPEGINRTKLCYSINDQSTGKNGTEQTQTLSLSQRQSILGQKLLVDSIVVDPYLRSLFHTMGLDTLMRLSDVNPCIDTISISRNGDTVPCNHYLYMKGILDNDTNTLLLSGIVTTQFQTSVLLVEPNYIGKLSRIPNDPHYDKQIGFNDDYSNIEEAWDYQTGNTGTKVAVIDAGVDWNHCDFGGNTGLGEKVSSGWNWVDNNNSYDIPGHGTQVASIIGGYTNRQCIDAPHGIAGVAGGWGPSSGGPEEGKGCQIIAHVVSGIGEDNHLDNVIAASLASIRSTGYGVHAINLSLGYREYSGSLLSVMHDAAANDVYPYEQVHLYPLTT